MSITDVCEYCYVNAIYVDGDEYFYDVVGTDCKFQDFYETVVDGDELSRILDSHLVVDFGKDGEYLTVCRDVPLVSGNTGIRSTLGKVTKTGVEVGTIYDLLCRGVKDGYFVVDDSYIDKPVLTSVGYTSFTNILFSQNTMTCYVRMLKDDGFDNRVLIAFENGVFKCRPFYFACKGECDFPGAELKGTITINGQPHKLYHLAYSKYYVNECIVSEPMINKAVFVAYVLGRCCLQVAHSYLGDKAQAIESPFDRKPDYNGTDGTYASCHGIRFDLFGGLPSKEEAQRIADFARADVVMGCFSGEGVIDACKEAKERYNWSDAQFFIASTTSGIEVMMQQGTEVTSAVQSYIDELKLRAFYAECYLYRVRVAAYLNRTRLAALTKSVLSGSEVNTSTVVKGGFYYGLD